MNAFADRLRWLERQVVALIARVTRLEARVTQLEQRVRELGGA